LCAFSEKGELGHAIEKLFGEQLEMLQQNQNAALSVKEMNTKFAALSAVFDGVFDNMDEFLGGVTEHVGLSHEPHGGDGKQFLLRGSGAMIMIRRTQK